jgi:hypothetical protein
MTKDREDRRHDTEAPPGTSAVFERITRSIDQDFPIEAIALLDSLIYQRLSDRLRILTKKGKLTGRLTLGQLCTILVGTKGSGGIEKDKHIRAVEIELHDWVKSKNKAVCSSANLFHSDTTDAEIHQILELHREAAREGIRLLRDFEDSE